LTTVLSDKMAELKNTIDLHNSGRDDEALVVVKTNHGRALMDEARGIFERLIDVAESKVTDSLEQQRQNISYLRWVTLVSALAIMLIVGGSVWTVLRYTRQLVDAELEVSTLNVGLEERVSERTADLGRANEEIQRFAYIVTHDLRAPLVNIMGFTSELETGLAAVEAYIVNATEDSDQTPVVKDARIAVSEDMPEAIGFIRSSTAKMDGLINAILRLSREGRRALKPEKIDLDELLRAASVLISTEN
jgi:signal transduction histidine kinase